MNNAEKLDAHLKSRLAGVCSSVDGIISKDELFDLNNKVDRMLQNWHSRLLGCEPSGELHFRNSDNVNESLFITSRDSNYPNHWKVGYSLREIDPSVVIKTVQQ